MTDTVDQFLVVDRTRTTATGAITAVPAGYTLQSDGDGDAAWVNVPIGLAANFAEFRHDNSTDNAPIAIGAPFRFGSPAGPASAGTSITQLSSSQFQLGAIGTYRITWQASVTEAGQMSLAVSDSATPGTPVELANSIIGRATGTSQIVGNTFLTTAFVNARVELWNASGSAAALTPTPTAGGAANAWTNITFEQMA